MAQAASHQLLNTETQVCSQTSISICGIFGEESGTGIDYSTNTLLIPSNAL
jgi:hypothetical protein